MQQEVETRKSNLELPLPRRTAMRRRTGRTHFGELQREAKRRNRAANRMMIGSVLFVLALVALFYKLLS